MSKVMIRELQKKKKIFLHPRQNNAFMSRHFCLLVSQLSRRKGLVTGGNGPDSELTIPVSASLIKQIIKCFWKKSWGCLLQLGTLQFQIKAGS